jgi:hypothetical protein
VPRPSIADLQAQIASLQAQVVPDMAGYVTMDLSNPSRPTLRIAGANLHVVNGAGYTASVNGLGNVIVGYDESGAFLPPVCSYGGYADETSCISAGGTWAAEHKSGSHSIVIGGHHRYSRYGALVAGSANTVNYDVASITGGTHNTASNYGAAVSGGVSNNASGFYASVSGGSNNTAYGWWASVSGGQENLANGDAASVSGGWHAEASGYRSSVSGGLAGWARGEGASISGGDGSYAEDYASSVSGGWNRWALDDYDWVAGSLSQDD